MKKTDVYVVVDTPKKSKKLKKVLDMFGENVYSLRFKYCAMGSLYKDEWHSGSTPPKNKTEVSIKELRNIFAKEHLKAGDVVILKEQGHYSISEFERMAMKSFEGQFVSKKYCNLYGSGLELDGGIHEHFIRYATEEEKALLDPKKELEVEKWYKYPDISNWMVCVNEFNNSFIRGYGFNSKSGWMSDGKWMFFEDNLHLLVESTPQEVEQALIEEAKRRGFVNGGVGNNSNIHDKKLKDCELFFNNQYEFDEKDNLLRAILDDDTTWTVFKDGQWASIIEQDNFTDSDLSIVERLHDTLLDNHGYSLESRLLTDARILANKIKSNIK